MQAGTLVIASNTGSPKESVLDEQTGYLCQDDTPECFGKAILKVLQNPSRATAMGHAGKIHVEKEFGANRLQRQWCDLVDEALWKCANDSTRRSATAKERLALVVILLILIVVALRLGNARTSSQEL